MIAPKIEKCRVCGNTDLVPVIDIGEQYLSSVFPEDLDYRKSAMKYPLDLVICKKDKSGKTCGLVQLGTDNFLMVKRSLKFNIFAKVFGHIS